MKKTTRFLALLMSLVLLCSGLSAFAAGDTASEQPVYVVIGDSIAAGTGLEAPEVAAYGAIVANTNGYEYVNHAVPGYTTGNLLKLIKTDEDVRSDLARADIISVSIGGNNFLLGNLPLLIVKALLCKNYDRFDKIVAELLVDFDAIIDEIKLLNPDATILMQNLYNPRYDFLREAYQQGVNRLNAAYASYLTENPGSYVLIDVETSFEGKQALIASDSIHPSADGHLELSRLLLNELHELGLGTGTEPVVAQADDSQKQNSFELFLIGIKNIFLTIRNLLF